MGVAFHERDWSATSLKGGWSSFVWLSPGETIPPPWSWGEKRYQVEGSPVSGEGEGKGFYICREEGKGTEFLSWIYGGLTE